MNKIKELITTLSEEDCYVDPADEVEQMIEEFDLSATAVEGPMHQLLESMKTACALSEIHQNAKSTEIEQESCSVSGDTDDESKFPSGGADDNWCTVVSGATGTVIGSEGVGGAVKPVRGSAEHVGDSWEKLLRAAGQWDDRPWVAEQVTRRVVALARAQHVTGGAFLKQLIVRANQMLEQASEVDSNADMTAMGEAIAELEMSLSAMNRRRIGGLEAVKACVKQLAENGSANGAEWVTSLMTRLSELESGCSENWEHLRLMASHRGAQLMQSDDQQERIDGKTLIHLAEQLIHSSNKFPAPVSELLLSSSTDSARQALSIQHEQYEATVDARIAAVVQSREVWVRRARNLGMALGCLRMVGHMDRFAARVLVWRCNTEAYKAAAEERRRAEAAILVHKVSSCAATRNENLLKQKVAVKSWLQRKSDSVAAEAKKQLTVVKQQLEQCKRALEQQKRNTVLVEGITTASAMMCHSLQDRPRRVLVRWKLVAQQRAFQRKDREIRSKAMVKSAQGVLERWQRMNFATAFMGWHGVIIAAIAEKKANEAAEARLESEKAVLKKQLEDTFDELAAAKSNTELDELRGEHEATIQQVANVANVHRDFVVLSERGILRIPCCACFSASFLFCRRRGLDCVWCR